MCPDQIKTRLKKCLVKKQQVYNTNMVLMNGILKTRILTFFGVYLNVFIAYVEPAIVGIDRNSLI